MKSSFSINVLYINTKENVKGIAYIRFFTYLCTVFNRDELVHKR